MSRLASCFTRRFASAAVIIALIGTVPGPAQAQSQADSADPRAFPETGFTIADDAIWTFFSQHGGSATLGAPISREFTLHGSPVQLFQNAALEVLPDGSVSVMQLTEPGLLPYTQLGGLTVPPADAALAMVTPGSGQVNYASRAAEFLRATVPDSWNNRPVEFLTQLMGASTADPLAGLGVWGMPTSWPAADPRNPDFVYQRFENGIMLYNAATASTNALPLGEYLKHVLTGRDLSPDLALQAADSPLLGQYDPSRALGLARPAALPDSDLANAFTPDVG